MRMMNHGSVNTVAIGAATRIRALRGAVTIESDTPQAVTLAVGELIAAIQVSNDLSPDCVISAFFSVTPDIRSRNPATAAREHGWNDVPILCSQEMMVDGSLPRCIRLLVHVEVDPGVVLQHQYLREARTLRPDRVNDIRA
jgi:chorismate mutase